MYLNVSGLIMQREEWRMTLNHHLQDVKKLQSEEDNEARSQKTNIHTQKKTNSDAFRKASTDLSVEMTSEIDGSGRKMARSSLDLNGKF